MSLSYQLFVSNRAKANLRSAMRWYDDQREGLGDVFKQVADEAILVIRESPYLFARYNVHYRRMVLPRFPYTVIYEVSEEERVITILRMVHQRRTMM